MEAEWVHSFLWWFESHEKRIERLCAMNALAAVLDVNLMKRELKDY